MSKSSRFILLIRNFLLIPVYFQSWEPKEKQGKSLED